MDKLQRMSGTYVSLFSGAGVGCHGLDLAGFQCVATVEINHRRLEIQKSNNKCANPSDYICGNLEDPCVLEMLSNVALTSGGVDIVVATPPCQGMSIFNHKKKDEIHRNSLVISAMETVRLLRPKVFIFENVAGFFKTSCGLPNGSNMPIGEAIEEMLGGQYHILQKVVNLKNYGCPSSRTRALAIGVDKAIKFSPLSLFPEWKSEKTLAEVIGDLQLLSRMGQISPDDVYHSFKPYDRRMLPWVVGLAEGKSAFDRKSAACRPHRIIDGKRVENKNGNGDKYRRQRWDFVPPCIHTRSDILASQNTIHPRDNRVFSIREVMRMLGVPDDFRWSNHSALEILSWSSDLQRKFLRGVESNIRQCLGEAVPPMVMFSIGQKINHLLKLANKKATNNKNVSLQKNAKVTMPSDEDLRRRVSAGILDVGELMRDIERANDKKEQHAAYYTPPVTTFKTLQLFPDLRGKKHVRILEPSVGVGQMLRFLPPILSGCEQVSIDVMDIDADVLEMAQSLFRSLSIPDNIKINFIHGDFLDHSFGNTRYDVIVGNPPFKKISAAEARHYNGLMRWKSTSRNVFALFLMKAMNLADNVVFICPKSFLNAPEYNDVRRHINERHAVRSICDFGEEGFQGVKLETIALAIETNCSQRKHERVQIESVPRNIRLNPYATDIFSSELPYWVIYRNEHFDIVLDSMETGIFSAFRDRQITKKHTSPSGELRVLKSRNVQPDGICSLPSDVYVNSDSSFAVQQYVNRHDVFLVPNLSYSPRACFMPKQCVTDGSLAILYSKDDFIPQKKDLGFFASSEFHEFYRVARNHGTRTLNIDSNSVFFFGVKK